MKKINKLFAFLLGFVAVSVLFTACSEDDFLYEAGDAFHFGSKTMSIAESSAGPAVIPIVFTKTSAIAGSVTVSVSSTTAVEGTDYIILGPTSFDFGANEYFDTLYIQPIDNSVQEADKTIDVVITSGTASLGYPGLEGGTSFDSLALTLLDDDCPAIPTLAGSYAEATSGGAGDGSGAIGTALDPFGYGVTINIASVGTDRYEVDDITMGLYVNGYGASGPNPATFDYNATSRAITIDMAASADIIYGGDAFFGSGMAIDDCDGILTSIDLSWANSWGDQGVSVLTPQ